MEHQVLGSEHRACQPSQGLQRCEQRQKLTNSNSKGSMFLEECICLVMGTPSGIWALMLAGIVSCWVYENWAIVI